MAEKLKSEETVNPFGRTRILGDIDPEDDVTSELSRPLAWVVDDSGLSASRVDPQTDGTLEPKTLLSDRFEIVELVHSGGMGHVYKAIDRRQPSEGPGQDHVAIKMLRESLSDRDDVRMMLEREAAKAQSLSHPNIINIFDFDEHEGRLFLVMEWLEGESVSDLLRRTRGQPLSPAFAWAVIEGAAAAIRHAHLNNVVHADINPSNIFVTATHDIKLLDFGVARYASDFDEPADDGATWVTHTYASPEVLSGLHPAIEDDVFSLGCVAYRLLAGEHPFAGSPSITAKHDGVAVKPIAGLPDSDWQILSQALAYSRSGRPHTVEAFLRNQNPFAAAFGITAGKSNWSTAFRKWRLPVAATVVAAVAFGSWFWPDAPVTEAIPDPVPEAPPTEATTETTARSVEATLVAEKLIAEGDAQLAAARMAAASGDIEQANAALAEAEKYAHIEPATINAVRKQLAGLTLEAAFLDRLAVVDEHIAAGRLLEPAGSNARDTLAELSDGYAGDPRLSAAYERLAERLLTRAAFAIAGGSVDEARSLIDAVGSLGVLENEVDVAKRMLTQAASRPAEAGVAEPESVTPTAETAGPESEAAMAVSESEPAQSRPDSTLSGSSEVAAQESQGLTVTRLEDLGLERFVAPSYPRGAQRRGLTGYVEVAFNVNPDGRTNAIEVMRSVPAEIFDESAANAVRKWRFAPRQDTIRANVALRFELVD